MRPNRLDDLVGLIYDAALDEALWADVVRTLATVVDTGQASFEWHDHDTGVMVRQAPLTDPAFVRSYREHYGREFNLLKRTGAFPVGQVFRTRDFVDTAWMSRTAYYNEWWKPQGVGGGSLFMNLALGERNTVLATACKHLGHEFTPEEERAFALAGRHMSRAVSIHSKMQLAALCRPPAGTDGPADILIVDERALILARDEAAAERLRDVGLLDRLNPRRILTPDGGIERLVRQSAVGRRAHSEAGASLRYGDADLAFDVTVFPCSEARRARWLMVERPAAMLLVSAPGERDRARKARLVAERGLTAAEAAVALEVARGHGRAAAAARLGIRETTVRSHLTAIFEKMGIHRQAELATIVCGGGAGLNRTG